MITSAVMLLISVVAVIPVQAATVSTLTDKVTSHDTASAGNHTVSFTTGTGASLGSTFVLTLDASFGTSSITEDDVDISDDGVDLTTATTCAGSEQASVAMASDVLTITICAGDGGAIAAGSVVAVEIGTNATSSGTGSNQITNPSSRGTYSIRLSGTFGDVGNVWIPIVTLGDIPVSAHTRQTRLQPHLCSK